MTLTVFDTALNESTPTRQTIVQLASPPPQTSPIPRIHTIQANDTLLDIAITYDIQLETLLLANPDVDPRALQIGQELVIPTSDNDVIQHVALPIVPLFVSSPECYPTSTDSLLCMGYIRNDQDQPVEQVSLDIQISDGSTILGTKPFILEQSYLDIGDIAPYRAIFNRVDSSTVEQVAVTLKSATPTDTLDNRFANLQVTNDTLARDGNQFNFSADIVNVGEGTSQPPRLVITLLDSDDRVYGYRIWEGNAPLFPEVSTRVQMTILPVASALDSATLTYNLHTEARLMN